MSCSAKFLLPKVTAGLPAPGCPLGAAVELVLLLLLLPQPAATKATRATSASAGKRRWNMFLLLVGHEIFCIRPDALSAQAVNSRVAGPIAGAFACARSA